MADENNYPRIEVNNGKGWEVTDYTPTQNMLEHLQGIASTDNRTSYQLVSEPPRKPISAAEVAAWDAALENFEAQRSGGPGYPEH